MQTKKMSMLESTVNYIITFILSWALNVTLFRAFGYHVEISDGFFITIICFPIVLGKNYIVRRIFNRVDSKRRLHYWDVGDELDYTVVTCAEGEKCIVNIRRG